MSTSLDCKPDLTVKTFLKPDLLHNSVISQQFEMLNGKEQKNKEIDETVHTAKEPETLTFAQMLLNKEKAL